MRIAGKNVCLNSCKMSSVKHMLVTDLVDGLAIVLVVKSKTLLNWRKKTTSAISIHRNTHII